MTATIPVVKGKVYWYRLQSQNKPNQRSMLRGSPFHRSGQGVIRPTVDRVNTDGARFNADINPNGGDVSWTFEYGYEPGFDSATPVSQRRPGPKRESGRDTGSNPGRNTTFDWR